MDQMVVRRLSAPSRFASDLYALERLGHRWLERDDDLPSLFVGVAPSVGSRLFSDLPESVNSEVVALRPIVV